jgi:hypothetical protein
MKVRMDEGDPCRYWVSSESDKGVEYIVDLCEWELGPDDEGVMQYNGVCGLTPQRIHGCRDFIFRCEKGLKNPENIGKAFRCKHINAAEKYALKLLKPYMASHRAPNHEDLQP